MLTPRRHCFRALGAFGASLAAPAGLGLLAPAVTARAADVRVEIAGFGANQIPVTIGRFRDEDKAPQVIAAIVRADLERSGSFRLVDAAAPADEAGAPDYAGLRRAASDAVAAGSVARLADGRWDVRFRLWDVLKGAELASASLPAPPAELRLAAHRIADQITEKLTGDKGVNATRLAYVTRVAGRHSLRIADADGEGSAQVVIDDQPIISPAWSPDGRAVAYVSFHTRKPVVVVQDLASGNRVTVADYKGSNSAPAFSPDGRDLAVTLSREGGSQIYLVGREGGNVRRVTRSGGIDTEPCFTPDGRSLYFTSDRGGSPQIYRQALAGGNAERVTFSGSYNISPALSPDGKLLAYVARTGNVFRTVVLDLANPQAQPQPVSDTSDDESPSFSPNGRLLVFATRSQGRDVLMLASPDGRFKPRVLLSGAEIREPAWGPWGR